MKNKCSYLDSIYFQYLAFSLSEIIGVIKIQSVWRGYRCRKQNRNMIMSLAVRRYQQHYSAMSEQINQLTSDLNRVSSYTSVCVYSLKSITITIFGVENFDSSQRKDNN